MSTKRKRYTVVFKSKVAVEAIRGVKTTAELASEHQVHPTLISERKRQVLENLASPFEADNTRGAPDVEAVTVPLCERIGRLKVKLDWPKKS